MLQEFAEQIARQKPQAKPSPGDNLWIFRPLTEGFLPEVLAEEPESHLHGEASAPRRAEDREASAGEGQEKGSGQAEQRVQKAAGIQAQRPNGKDNVLKGGRRLSPEIAKATGGAKGEQAKPAVRELRPPEPESGRTQGARIDVSSPAACQKRLENKEESSSRKQPHANKCDASKAGGQPSPRGVHGFRPSCCVQVENTNVETLLRSASKLTWSTESTCECIV